MIQRLPIELLQFNEGQIPGLSANPRQWTRDDVESLARSLEETPELFEARPIIAIPYKGYYIVLGGNMRLAASRENNYTDVPCYVLPETTPLEKQKEIVIKDNSSFGAWDYDELGNNWDDLPLTDWGVPAWDTTPHDEEWSEAEIERKRKEFEERMKAGEISEEDEEYQQFKEKFELKKTTDDCYTPPQVYDAVADYVAEKYGVNKAAFVRPFYPGGDYQKERYVAGCVVVDNPPFSILAEILRFYTEKKIKFFLFAPTLTLFSSSSSCTCLPVAVTVTYENGANVNTSFITNLEPKEIRLRSAPELYKSVKDAADDYRKNITVQLPKYEYDKHVITSSFIANLSRLGVNFAVPVAESISIDALDAQKEHNKAIYGKGYLVSDRVVKEREKAEREKVMVWKLSERELGIIAKMNN